MKDKKKEKAGLPVFRIVLLLLFVAIACFAYYNWPSRAEYISDADNPQKQVEKESESESAEKNKLRQRTRTASPELSNEAYREMLIRKDKQMLERRRAELRRLRKKYSLKNRRNVYADQKEQLQGIIREYGIDSAPNSITRDAAIRLKRLEEDAPY